jgi:3-phenylpropionate/cinnamic acid dioxygenase small subunit
MTDEESIRRTVAEFCQFLDDRRFEDWSKLFTEDGEFQHLKGRVEILQFILGDQLATIPELKRKHTISNIIIDVSGDEATAASDLVIFDRMGDGPWTYKVGDYTDKLVRQGDRWLFAKRQLVLMD